MSRRQIFVSIALACAVSGALGVPSVVRSEEPVPDAPDAAVAAQESGSFLETFDLDREGPVNFSDTIFAERWHVANAVADYQQWENGDPVDAQHGSDCAAPPATHRADTWDEYVYVCKNHLMTARAAPSYAATYLMPLAELDLSGPSAFVRFDVSTLSMSSRDWIDFWLTPIDDLLAVPIDHEGPAFQGLPRNAVHVRGGNGSERWTISVIRDFQVVRTTELLVPANFDFSPKTRTAMELRIGQGQIRFSMAGVGSKTLAADPGFDQGFLQWGHHAYNPTKDNSGVPATWHWDNFQFEPAVPVGVNRVSPSRAIANPGQVRTLTFQRPALGGDRLMFDGVCRVELDFGSGFQPIAKQPTSEGNPTEEAASSYLVPVPAGATSVNVRFRGDGWYDGWPCIAENPIILNSSGQGGAVPPGSNFISPFSSRCVAVPGASPGDVAVVNITNTQATGRGWGALRASGETPVFDRPVAAQVSSVNFAAGTPPNPNLAFSKVGSDGMACYDGAVFAHHVILDLAAVIPASNVNAVTPTRILDTRNQSKVAASSSRCVAVPGASPGDVAVVNITNTQAAGQGWGALRASGETPVFGRAPSAQVSSVNFAAGTPPNPNLAFSKVGSDNKVCYDGAVFAHHVILDLAAVIPASNVNAVTPTRILDTRNQSKVAASSSRCVAVPGASPGDVAVVNITNTQAAGQGWGALRASGETPVFGRAPSAQVSSVNFAAGTPPNPNLAFSKVGSDNKVCYDGAVFAHHVILDLAAVIPASNVNAVTPTRILDTRP